MSVKKFIESGVIESYVLGICSPDELKAVKAMKAKHPTVKTEIKAVREALTAYALKHDLKPPEPLRGKILSSTQFVKPKPDEKNREPKNLNGKKEAKAQENKVEVKPADIKSADIKPPEVKITKVEPLPVKPSEVKTPEVKSSEPVVPVQKAPEVKVSEEKLSEQKLEKAIQPEIKPLERIAEVKPLEKKIQETKITSVPVLNKGESRGSESKKSFVIVTLLMLLVISLYYNYHQHNKLREDHQQILELQADKDLITQQLGTEKNSLDAQLAEKQSSLDLQKAAAESAKRDLALVLSSFKPITITGEGANAAGKELYSNGTGTVYWNPNSKEVYILLQNLPSPDATHDYQLWAMADGKPVNAGVFDLRENISGVHHMKNVPSAQMFIVTLEPRGGSASPTLNAICLTGKVS